ncbi:hypothetical protein CROQUDRAFT_43546 [Cronartium quercuum f. sp. fusiforme G11]|uniref:Laccase n=1 Tax=Cronartium quercuum f. sp. fusiforme G11 TaxID=708437 RepID=A0A9P6TCT5_9BASI|nr:hypothetical protein CROQUDRAFT_43546 [Cronartium quercuum f. sp. fusiforme G11]
MKFHTPWLWIISLGIGYVVTTKSQGPEIPAQVPNSEYLLNPNFVITSKTQTRKYTLVVHNTTASPDGFWREVLAINNQMPGPLIEANEGDRLEITVINRLDSPLTMHWHGIYQNGTNWEDGPAGITQCPIPVGGTYTYQFSLDGQFGTYCKPPAHYESLRVEGINGPLIIHSPRDPLKRKIDFDQEMVLMLTDWFHTPADQIVPQILSHTGYHGFPTPPSPNSALINGIGEWDCRFATTTQRCRQNAPPEFTVVAGSRIRYRLINSGSHAMFFFSADNHTLNVTEADATPVHGREFITNVHRVIFHNGQRYSVIVNIPLNEAGSSFYLRAKMDPDCWPWVTNDLQGTAYAIIRVVAPGSRQRQVPSKQRPTTQDWAEKTNNQCMDLDPNSLVPIIPVRVPTAVLGTGTFTNALGFKVLSSPPASSNPSSGKTRTAKRQLDLSGHQMIPPLGMNTTSPGQTNNTQIPPFPPQTVGRFFINNITAVLTPQQPVLHDLVHGGSGIVNSSNIASVVFPELGYYDLYLVNTDAATNHPFHLHGPDMHIVAQGSGLPTPENLKTLTYRTENPLRRDTMVIQGGTFTVVRINTDLPGVWFLHCHMDWHVESGLAGVLVVQPEKVKSFEIPKRTRALCRNLND